jgi:hypothetical protein
MVHDAVGAEEPYENVRQTKWNDVRRRTLKTPNKGPSSRVNHVIRCLRTFHDWTLRPWLRLQVSVAWLLTHVSGTMQSYIVHKCMRYDLISERDVKTP